MCRHSLGLITFGDGLAHLFYECARSGPKPEAAAGNRQTGGWPRYVNGSVIRRCFCTSVARMGPKNCRRQWDKAPSDSVAILANGEEICTQKHQPRARSWLIYKTIPSSGLPRCPAAYSSGGIIPWALCLVPRRARIVSDFAKINSIRTITAPATIITRYVSPW